MVIPWVGFPLSSLIKLAEPTGNAKFLQFVTLNDPKRLPGQKLPTLEWPYVEGLRMDEAMHPLTILSVGLYGEVLPAQNGAPIRVVVAGLGAAGVRLLLEREPRRGPPALEPGARAPDRGVLQAEDADVQRLRRPSRQLIQRHGSEKILLKSN